MFGLSWTGDWNVYQFYWQSLAFLLWCSFWLWVIIQKMWIVMGKKCLIAILFTCKKNKYLSCLIRTLKQCRRLRKKLPNLNSNLLLRKAHCVWWLLFKNKMLTLDDVLFYHYYQNYVAYSTKYTYRNKNYNLLTNTKDIQGHT